MPVDFNPVAPDFLARIASLYGGNELIVLEDDRLSYADLEERSRSLAKALLASGLSKGTRLGILLPNGPDAAVLHIAAARMGAVAVPINTFFKAQELGFVLDHADIDTLVAVPAFLGNNYVERLEQCVPELKEHQAGKRLRSVQYPYLRQVLLYGDAHDLPAWAESVSELPERARQAGVDDALLAAVEARIFPADPLVIIYSSGSTSQPKGAIHSHGAVLRHALQLQTRRPLAPTDRMYSTMPMFWVGGLVFNFYSVLHAGACLICETVFNPTETLALIERERVTHLSIWPHYTQSLAQHPDVSRRDLSRLQDGTVNPASKAYVAGNGLGMTETCGPHSLEDFTSPVRGTFGQAFEGIERKIVDPDTGVELPVDKYGELCVRGYSLMQGLYKVERQDVFDADGYYRTGDICRIDPEGFLHFRARKGDMIKSAGTNITPSEVEAVIHEIPGVQLSCVVGLPHESRGQEVAAAVVLEEGVEIDGEMLRAQIKEQLSAYKVPRQIFVMTKNELPFTDSGKIHRVRLVEQLVAMTS